MKAWFQRLFAPVRPAAPQRPTVSAKPDAAGKAAGFTAPPLAAALAPPAVQARSSHPDTEAAFFSWLIEVPMDAQAGLDQRERRALRQLDRLLDDGSLHASLLPREANLLPQLLARLRAASSSLSDLSQQVSRDLTLVAEVIRMANSPYYRRDAAVVELDSAIRALGTCGLQSAMARTVLKPVLDARSGAVVRRSARRLWDHTDKKAQLCSALSVGKGLDPFEGYLLGLVHNAGWHAVLRTLDEVDDAAPWRLGPAFAAALHGRRDQLFSVIARKWALSDSLTRVAAEMASSELHKPLSAPLQVLATGERLAWLLCSGDAIEASALAEDLLVGEAKSVRACFVGLAAPLAREQQPEAATSDT